MAWGIGLTLYVLVGLGAAAIVPIYIPWLGTLFTLTCVVVHVDRRKTDEPILLGFAVGQICVATLATLLVRPSSSSGRWAFNLTFFLAALAPVFVAVYGLRKSGPTLAKNGSRDD